ncbi:MAG TPA: dienelactone hydrolase family protein, partial [Steroidobacteraceae bacterium]
LLWRQSRAVSGPEVFDVDAGVVDAEATIAQARTLSAGNGRVGVMGFSLGGLLAFLTAARTCVDAAVAYYGGRTEEFLNEAPDIDGPLQMHLAGNDEFMPKAAHQQIVMTLADNAQVEIYSYDSCHHAFSRRGGSNYDAAAALLSRARALEFFKRHL